MGRGRSRRSRSDRERKAIFARLGHNTTKVRIVHETSHDGEPRWKTNFTDPRVNRSIYTGNTVKKIPKKEPPKSNRESNSKPREQTTSNFSEVTRTVQNIPPEKFANLLAGGLATGLSVTMANPLPLLAYKSIKTAKTLYDVSNNMEKINLKEELKDIVNTYLEATGQEVLKQKIELVSKKVTEQSDVAGIIKLLSESSNYDESAARLLFQNTVNNVIDGSIGTLTSLVVDTLL